MNINQKKYKKISKIGTIVEPVGWEKEKYTNLEPDSDSDTDSETSTCTGTETEPESDTEKVVLQEETDFIMRKKKYFVDTIKTSQWIPSKKLSAPQLSDKPRPSP
jgi:hypothetical protein